MATTKSAKKSAVTIAPIALRRRGRPSVSENGLLDRKLIIACALQLARSTPLQELSIVRVAKELGVTPALIHYYLNGRDALTSGIMNAFYHEMLQDWPEVSGEWRADVEAMGVRIHQMHVSYPGIAAYAVANNRFRLKQILVEGETDYGLMLFERFVGVAREAGLDAYRTARGVHLLIEFLVSTAYASVRHLYPGEHGDLLNGIFSGLDPAEFPNMAYIAREYTKLNASDVFPLALKLLINSIELEVASTSSERLRLVRERTR